jgi:hypothetical protein
MKNIIVFTVDAPELEGLNNYGLGNVIKNIYGKGNPCIKVFYAFISDPVSKWISFAKEAEDYINGDTIIHSHDMMAHIPAVILKSKHPHIPWIHSFHYSYLNARHRSIACRTNCSEYDFNDKIPAKFELEAFSKADYLIFNSNFMVNDFFERYKYFVDIAARKRTVLNIPNGYDANIFRKIKNINSHDVKKKYLFPDKKRIILFYGQFTEIKGYQVVRNLGIDSYISDNYIIILIGNNNIKKRIAYKLNNTFIHEFPKMGQALISEIINISDYVILPSFYEPFGQTALEASAVNRPFVIVTKENGFEDFIISNKSYIESPSVLEITAKIKEMDMKDVRRRDIIKTNYKYIKKYKWEYIRAEYNKLYERARPLNINYCESLFESRTIKANAALYKTNRTSMLTIGKLIKEFNNKYIIKSKAAIISLYEIDKRSKCKYINLENYFYEINDMTTEYEVIILADILSLLLNPIKLLDEILRVKIRMIVLITTTGLKYLMLDYKPAIINYSEYLHINNYSLLEKTLFRTPANNEITLEVFSFEKNNRNI